MHTLRAALSISLLLACTPKEATTDGSTGSSGAQTDGVGTTSATGTATTDSPTSTDGTSSTGVEPTTPTASSSQEETTTTGTDTGDETGGGLPGACAAMCAHMDACSPGILGPVPECTASCTEETEGTPGCSEALAAQWSCVAGLACEEALKFLEGDPTSCTDELGAADEACFADERCNGEVGGGGDSCQFERDCNGLKESIDCNADTCTCMENDIAVGDCPINGLCDLDPGPQYAAVNACCGFMWK